MKRVIGIFVAVLLVGVAYVALGSMMAMSGLEAVILLALLIVVFKMLGRSPGREGYREAARFWIRIFGINFAVGVVTGISAQRRAWMHFRSEANHAGTVPMHLRSDAIFDEFS